jgi:hypothetical protein
MTAAPIWVVTAIYAVQAGICMAAGQHAQTVILIGYVVANIGLAVMVGS